MEDVGGDEDGMYRGYAGGKLRTKGELVDDLSYRGYRPRTLSESHPSHPLHAMQDPSPAFTHDFLVHEVTGSDGQVPVSPQSYHSGDSMETEHSSPVPELEGETGRSGGDGVDTTWALNLDQMDSMPLSSLELPVS